MTENKKNILLVLFALMLIFVVLQAVYPVIEEKVPPPQDESYVTYRDLETTGKLWFNGYLGLFFRFNQLGNVNWLILPLLIYFLIGIRTRPRWQRALVFVWIVSTLFICLKGYTNLRYQLTLFPVTVVLLLLLLWEFLKDRKHYIKIICFSLVAILCIFNVHRYFAGYQFYNDIKLSVDTPHFPDRLVEYIDNCDDIRPQNRVYVFEQPLFYYHTEKRGLDYQDFDGVWPFVEMKRTTRVNRTKAHKLLRQFNVGYLLMQNSWRRMYHKTMLREFLNCECRLVIQDNGWYLYKMGDQALINKLKSPEIKKIKVWNAMGDTYRELSPPIKRFQMKGRFKFNVRKAKKENTMLVRYMGGQKEGEKRISFGYEFKRMGLTEEIPEGSYVHFIGEVSISPELLNTSNNMFITQYNGVTKKWDAQKYYFSSPHWRTCKVSLKIKKGCNRLIMGFRYTAKSKKDQLKFKNMAIYISKKPLIEIEEPENVLEETIIEETEETEAQ